MTSPLIKLCNVSRYFTLSDQNVARVLKNISLTIYPGEMIAIVGTSGSGKTTLLNILGCLDKPTSGQYWLADREVAQMSINTLAKLRCEHFGFVFQRYYLLPYLTVLQNAELAAIYAGQEKLVRKNKAIELLTQLGLSNHLDYSPEKLSGGQQQRVSIARALINGGHIILADEPTGALDGVTSQQIMALFKLLHTQGHTIILVTHNDEIAAQAERIIKLHDGAIISDKVTGMQNNKTARAKTTFNILCRQEKISYRKKWLFYLADPLHIAWLALSTNKLRTCLTLLGIIVGIVAILLTVIIGKAVEESMLKDFRTLAINKIRIFPGKQKSDYNAHYLQSLVVNDVYALSQQSFIKKLSPIIASYQELRLGKFNFQARVTGVSDNYFNTEGISIAAGRHFTKEQVEQQAQVAVIDYYTQKQLFPKQNTIIGQTVLVGRVPMQIIGVTQKKEYSDNSSTLHIWIPYTTAASKLVGRQYFDYINVLIAKDYDTTHAVEQIERLLILRHGQKDFTVDNLDEWLKLSEKMFGKLQQFLTLIALIALLIGGIGVMNIMLVSVAERISEIGIRVAVGACQRDIQKQFLIESIIICLLGASVGILLSISLAFLVKWLRPDWPISFSAWIFLVVLFCSMLIGFIFGFLPANRAARLNPIDALTRS